MERLTLDQRYKIETLQQEGYKYAQIALKLDKHKSVIYRELKRNSDQRNGQYKAALAQRKSEAQSLRTTARNLLNTSIFLLPWR